MRSHLILTALPVILLAFFASVLKAGEDEGKLVCSIQKPLTSLEAFKASLGMGRQVAAPWWRLYSSNIYSLNPDGTGLKQLTDDGISRRPEWSLDGKLIAYISGIGESENLYVMDQDGLKKRALLENQIELSDFWWSADSSSILVSVNTKRRNEPMENWVVAVDEESKKRMGSRKWAGGWNHWDAFKAEIVNPNLRLISILPKDVERPEWSPDKRYITFITSSGNQRILAVADVENAVNIGKWLPQLSEPPCDKIYEWSRNGKKILFQVASRICSAELQKGKLETFINVSHSSGDDATWNRDGSKVAFVKTEPGRDNREIYIVNSDGSSSTRITNTNYDHSDLDWR